mgnify:CR=1 FL=1
MKQSQRSPLGYYTIGIAALFLAGFFLLVLFGAQIYRSAAGSQELNFQTRSLNSYLATCARANDAAGGIQVLASDYGQVLVLADGDSGYGLRIYPYEGSLVEDYAALDAPLSPESAQVIGKTGTFEIQSLADGLLCVSTDAGRVLLGIRSEGNGEGS